MGCTCASVSKEKDNSSMQNSNSKVLYLISYLLKFFKIGKK